MRDSPFWVRFCVCDFFNPIIEVVTFFLCGSIGALTYRPVHYHQNQPVSEVLAGMQKKEKKKIHMSNIDLIMRYIYFAGHVFIF